MAGPITHRATHAIFQRMQDAFRGRQLVEASVEMLGRTYRTNIREGASAEDLIEKIAKENDGGVAKVYYPEFRTWEIVAVKIGDQVMVKDSPEKVAKADFSQFPDPGFRSMAIRAAASSEGGIHFSIGKSGIPLAIMDNEEIVFPNAEELRIGRNTSSISLWMTSVNVNPASVAELSQVYSPSGGLQVSRDALKKIEESHGGTRSDKLFLDDNILVLNKDTGEIFTASQLSAPPSAQPGASFGFALQDYSIRSDIAPAPSALHNYDGSQVRNPYLAMRAFDGQLREHLRVQINAIPEQKTAAGSSEMPKGHASSKPPNSPLSFTILRFDPVKTAPARPPDDFPPGGPGPSACRALRPGTAGAKSPESGRMETHEGKTPPPESTLTTEIILKKFSEPRRAKLPLGTPSSVSALAHEPSPAVARKKRKRKRPEMKGIPNYAAPLRPELRKKRGKDGHRTGSPPKGLSALKAKSRQKPPPAARRRPLQSPRKGVETPRGKKGPVGKPASAIRKTKSVKQAPKPPNSLKPQLPAPKNARIARLPEAKKRAAREMRLEKKPAVKKIHSYFLREMLGILPQWKKRGRKLRTKKKSAV
ncbi:MAG TPA: hypothetical protein VLD37_01860 [Candidatus Bilamarchaeum sp.]|nr:hypothetical protein [Candidatus Bilamarchaeum sp.]